MSEYICNLSLRVRQPSEAYRIRDAIREFLDNHDGCRVTGCGRSCIDPTFTDIEIRVKSRQIADRVVAAVRSTYASICEIDAEMIAQPKLATALDTPLRKLISISIKPMYAAAQGQCEMCGRTIERHGATLALDYKISREWGGRDEDENLWMICEDCSNGKAENFQDEKCALNWIGNIFANDIVRAGKY